MNFIGAFVVPAHIVTPMELEEQRVIQEKEAAKKQRAKRTLHIARCSLFI
jgi:hypothetical protein